MAYEATILVILLLVFIFQLVVYIPVAMYQFKIFSGIAQATSMPFGIQTYQSYLTLTKYLSISIIINLIMILVLVWFIKNQ